MFLFAAAILTLLTIPPTEAALANYVEWEWLTWWEGIGGRLATSALASTAVSYVAVLLHFFDLRRVGSVRWSFTGSAAQTGER